MAVTANRRQSRSGARVRPASTGGRRRVPGGSRARPAGRAGRSYADPGRTALGDQLSALAGTGVARSTARSVPGFLSLAEAKAWLASALRWPVTVARRGAEDGQHRPSGDGAMPVEVTPHLGRRQSPGSAPGGWRVTQGVTR